MLENAFGLRVSRGGLAFERVAKKAEPTYEKLVEQIRGSPSVTPDETGWKVGGSGIAVPIGRVKLKVAAWMVPNGEAIR